MLTIVHGENLIKSRERLFQLKQLAQSNGQQLNTLLAKKISPQKLEESLLAKDLFGQEQCLIIEQLHSLPHSKKRSTYIESIQQASQFLNIILWEKKSLSKNNLKKFPQAKVFSYPMGKALWQLVDQLNPKPSAKKGQLLLLQQAIEQDSAEFCLSMISKRVSDLIAIKVDAQVKIHPFVKNKLEKQKQNFSLRQLLNFHQKLYNLDHKLKHSHNLLSLASELDLLLITL
jgi:DNA polymerase III delta subunit